MAAICTMFTTLLLSKFAMQAHSARKHAVNHFLTTCWYMLHDSCLRVCVLALLPGRL